MNNLARQTLRNLIAKHGAELSRDARRLEGLLLDHCGAHRREINVLTNALEERVAADLLAANPRLPLELLFKQLEKRLEENLALTSDAARWAVASWALALNVATEAEIRAREQSQVEINEETVSETERANSPANFEPQKTPAQTPIATKQPPATFKPPPSNSRAAFPPNANNSIAARPSQNPAVYNQNAANAATPNQTARAQNAPPKIRPKRRWFSFGGCLGGCLLLLIVLAALLVAAPYALKVMRETQQPPISRPQPR